MSLVCLDVLAEYASVRLERGDRSTIVALHQARVSRYVRGKNRRELSAAFGVDHIYTRIYIPHIMTSLTRKGYLVDEQGVSYRARPISHLFSSPAQLQRYCTTTSASGAA